MTTSSITSIEKYVLLKGSAAELASRSQILRKKPPRSSDEGFNRDKSNRYMLENDRYENRIGRFDRNASRITKQNQVALTVRAAQSTMQQIGMRINQMEDTLGELVKQYPPYPPGSEERIALLRKVSTFRKQIEELTFPPLKDENASVRSITDTNLGLKTVTPTVESTGDEGAGYPLPAMAGEYGLMQHPIPELAEDAPDGQIKASIVRLRQTGALIQRQRNELKTGTNLLFRGKGLLKDNEAAEFKSLFIGKHLSRHADCGITATPSILTGCLN